MKTTVTRALLPLLVLAAVSTSSNAADWPAWRGPNGDGISSEKLPDAIPDVGLKRAWKAQVGVGFSAAAVADGRLYTLGNLNKSDTATLFCLDAATGAEKWRKEWPSKLQPTMYEGGPNASPIVEGDALYVVIKPARVLRLKAATGDVEWDVDLQTVAKAELTPWGIAAAPRVVGDALVLNYGSNGTLLDKKTGKLRWTTGTKSPSFNVPAPAKFGADPGLLVLATNAVVGVRLKDGSEVFRHPFGEGYFCHASDPLVQGSSAFVSSADHGGQRIDFTGSTYKVAWKSREFGNFMASPILVDGHLYGINACDAKQTETTLRCVDWATGKVLWSEPGFGWGSFVATKDNKLLILSDKGELTLGSVSPKGFKSLGRFQALGGKCWTPPVLSNGRIFLRNAAGDLVCYETIPAAS